MATERTGEPVGAICETCEAWLLRMWKARLGELHRLTETAFQKWKASGWRWAQVYLMLVRRFLGVSAHNTLRDSFKAHGVKYRPPRKRKPREFTPEQKLARDLALVRAHNRNRLPGRPSEHQSRMTNL